MAKEFSMTLKEMWINWKLFEESYTIKPLKKMRFLNLCGKPFCELEEKRNDVYFYKTLRYPPKSTPPTSN